MKQYINEAKRMQFLAGIINESQLSELNDAEKDVVDAILGEGINEGKFNPKEILDKLISAAKKGLLTVAILSSVLTSCNFDTYTEDNIKEELSNIEWNSKYQVDSAELAEFKDENLGVFEQALESVKAEKDSTLGILKNLLEPEGFQYDPADRTFVHGDIFTGPGMSQYGRTTLRIFNSNKFGTIHQTKGDTRQYYGSNGGFINSPEEAAKIAIELKNSGPYFPTD